MTDRPPLDSPEAFETWVFETRLREGETRSLPRILYDAFRALAMDNETLEAEKDVKQLCIDNLKNQLRALAADAARFEFWFSLQRNASEGSLDQWRESIDEWRRNAARKQEEGGDA